MGEGRLDGGNGVTGPEAVGRQTRPAWQHWRTLAVAVRGCLVVLWLVWALLAWWSAPRPTDADQARHDISVGAVRSAMRAELWDQRGGFWGTPTTPRSAENGMFVVWTTELGQTRYAAPDHPVDPGELGSYGGTGTYPQADLLGAQLRAAAADSDLVSVGQNRISSTARLLAGVLMVLFVLILVAGPAPVRGTRFYWFWIALVPFGLGVLAWLGRERPLSRPALPLRSAAGTSIGDQRRKGFEGFLLLIVTGIGLSLLTYGLRELFGPGVVPG
jgi:hypothetical protein